MILATRNPHKLVEFRRLLGDEGVAPLPPEVELGPEVGATFAANALDKARVAARATGSVAIADDSGICAAALGGAPGVRSARFAGEGASDQQNLELLIERVPAGSALTYVCVVAYVDPRSGDERLFEGRCEGRMAAEPRGSGGFGYDPVFIPDGGDGRTMAELDGAAKDALSHRGEALRALSAWLAQGRMSTPAAAPAADREPTRRAAALSVASNATLITLKVIAGIATGSVAVLTEAAHSGMDLIASLVAFLSVRKAGEPADAGHPYGHEKMENMAGAIEGTLVLFGAAIITYEALLRLARGGHVHTIGIGIAVIAVSAVVNLVVSRIIGRRARLSGSVALEADALHLSADVASSVAVLVGLVLVAATGAEWIDPAVALVVAFGVAVAGVRILLRSSRALVDESLPEDELEWIRSTIRDVGAQHGVVAFHKLRARQAGSRRYVDVHVQFEAGTTLEAAHEAAHDLTGAIRARLEGADILVHVEPRDRVEPGTEIAPAGPGNL
jgi:non-canonical purine NTP pyrophosphatase (RdgB/HAM1 family)